jgi:hypothetical protein
VDYYRIAEQLDDISYVVAVDGVGRRGLGFVYF